MADEIISGIASAGYDILQDVFKETTPHLLQENEILKNMLTHLTSIESASPQARNHCLRKAYNLCFSRQVSVRTVAASITRTASQF